MNPMKKVLLTATVVLCAGIFVHAQTKPNFSGTWVSVEPREMAGEEQKVTHTADELILEHASEGGGHRIVHKLDGKEHDSSLGDIKSRSRAEWQGDKLVLVENATYPDGRKIETRSTWSLGSDGRLTVEGTRTGPDGKPETVKIVSTKKK